MVFSISVLSLGLYVAYMWISNYALSNDVQDTSFIAWTTPQTYFVVLFCICIILFLDGVIVFIDFRRGSYASKMREVIVNEQINNRYFYDKMNLSMTEGLTEQEGH